MCARIFQTLILVAVGISLIGGAMAPARAELRFDLDYDMHTGGMHALSMTVVGEVHPDHYRITTQAATQGMVDLLAQWRDTSMAEGRVVAGQLQPQNFTQNGTWRSGGRTAALSFGDDGAVQVTRNGKPRPIAPDAMSKLDGAADLLTALLNVMVAGNGQACQGRRAVFDGKRRYDLVFAPGQAEELSPSQYAKFSGSAQRCRVDVEPVQGFRTVKWAKDDGEKPVIDMWLAPFADGQMQVPVRLQAQTKYGIAVVHMRDASVKVQ